MVALPAFAEAETLPPPVSPACVSSAFGARQAEGPKASRFHTGIDLPAPAGAAVRAVAAGRVVRVHRGGARGLEVELRHASGLITRYAHLGAIAAPLIDAMRAGKRDVAQGQMLGRIGRTGVTYGTHVHLEVVVNGAPVDPAPYFALPPCKS